MNIENEVRSVIEMARRRVKLAEEKVPTPERAQSLVIDAFDLIETLAQALLELSENQKP